MIAVWRIIRAFFIVEFFRFLSEYFIAKISIFIWSVFQKWMLENEFLVALLKQIFIGIFIIILAIVLGEKILNSLNANFLNDVPDLLEIK